MHILRQIWSVLGAVILIIGVYFAAKTLPKFKRVMPDTSYDDMSMVATDATTGVDGTVAIHQLRVGDIIAYHLPNTEESAAFGYVVGLPGQLMKLENMHITVNDSQFKDAKFSRSRSENSGTIVVPHDCVMVLSEYNTHDSTKYGPIPYARVIGRAKGL